MDKYNEVYDKLVNIEYFNLDVYNNLLRKYNKEVVIHVIEDLIFENSENIDKFGICLDDRDNLYNSKLDLVNYSIFLADLKKLECFDSKKNLELLTYIHEYILKMNVIFDKYGVNSLDSSKKVLWIADKIEWCLNNCDDLNVINELKSLYKDYINIRDQLVAGNLRFVLYNAFQYNDDITMIEDMIQYGSIGLIRAIEKFDISKNTSFTTYAFYWIRQSITKGIKSIKYPMRMPFHIIYKNSLLMENENMLSIENGRSIRNIELADYMDLSLLNMEQILNAFKIPISMDECVPVDSEEIDYVGYVKDFIPDLNVDVSDYVVSLEYRKQLLNFLSEYLLDREYIVVYLYYGFSGKNYTDKEIAKEMGLSQQRIGQIKRDALVKLRRRDIRYKIMF